MRAAKRPPRYGRDTFPQGVHERHRAAGPRETTVNRVSGNEPQAPILVDARPLLKASALHLLAWSGLAAMFFMVDPVVAVSTLTGAAIAILPGAVMAWGVFRFRKGVAPRDYTRAVYRGELGKFLLTVVLFALAFTAPQPLSAPALFPAFLVALVVQWGLSARYLLRH